MRIDQIDLKIIREVENGGRIFLDKIGSALDGLNIKKDEIESRLARIESERLIQGYKVTIRIPPLLGGDWIWGCALAVISEPEKAIDQIVKNLPFVMEIMQNISVPDGIGPNLGILFYTKDFSTSAQFLRELTELNYVEFYKLREYSFPIPAPLSSGEKGLLRELYANPTASHEELSRLTNQDLVWVKEKLSRLITSPEYIVTDATDDVGIMQVLPELDWRVCENFCHIHFLIEKGTEKNCLGHNEFQPVLTGRPFRERFCQIETDLWGFDQLGAKLKTLKQSNVNVKGIILAETNHVVNHWALQLLE
jgi:DNA-binding Lrp family transcriptional regulator